MTNTLQLPPIPTSIIGISDITVKNAKLTNNNEFIITVESTVKEIRCTKCNAITSPHGHGKTLTLRHLPIFGNETYIEIAPARGICRVCDKNPTTTQKTNWYNGGSGYTKAYEKHILLSLINSTISDVAIKETVPYDAVSGIVDRHIETKADWSSISNIGLLGVDEISLKKGYKDYVTLVTSKTDQCVRILGIVKGREKAAVKAFFESIPKRLKKTIVAICSDLYDGFINAAKEVFGGTPVIADRYHVSKLYRKSLVSLRRSELKKLRSTLSEEEYKKLKPAISLLCHRKECELSDAEKVILKPLFDISPKIKEAYAFSLQLTAIYNKHATPDEASDSIKAWITAVETSDIKCFNSFIGTLRKYQKEICNYFIDRNNSGFVEGYNNKAKVLKRRCYGIFNLKHLFQRMVLDFLGYSFLGDSNLAKTQLQL